MILLIHSAAGSYLAALRRARMIQRGAEIVYPEHRFDRVLGRTPDDDPVTGAAPTIQRLVDYAARLLGHMGGVLDSEAVEAVWAVSALTADVREQLALAAQAGIPTRVLRATDVEWLLGLGSASEWADTAPAAPVDDEGPEFGSPVEVLITYFGGAEQLLGLRAMPVVRLALSGGSSVGRRDRLELCGLRIAFAAGIVKRAVGRKGWRSAMLPILRAVYSEGAGMAQAAIIAGLGDGDVARRRASRLRSRALDLVREEMAETEARSGSARNILTR